MASDIPEVPLQRPYLKGGIQRVSWWNGRVLTAEDMRDLQMAVDGSDRQLGEVVGEGVARGFVVTREPDGTAVRVTPGRAVNRAGEVLALDNPLRVPLVAPDPRPEAVAAHASFVACADVPASTTPTGTGIYLLTVASAEGTRGSAPAAQPDRGSGEAADCGPRYTASGVQFRLVGVDTVGLAEAAGHDQADLDVLASAPGTARRRLLRNVLAHLFLGTVAFRRHVFDPLGLEAPPAARPGYGPFDTLYNDGGSLTECDVPLALLSWSQGGTEFVDMHAVRRKPIRTRSPVSVWAEYAATRRTAEAEAALLQFQDHVAQLVRSQLAQPSLSAIVATEYFRYLPAVGFLPTYLPEQAGSRGFLLDTFLPDAAPPTDLPLPEAERLVRHSFDAPAIDVHASTPNLYTVATTLKPPPPLPELPSRPFVLVSGIRAALTDVHARHVSYEPAPDCQTLNGITDVQEALDRLCRPPRPRITSLEPSQTEQGRVLTATVHGQNLAGTQRVVFTGLGVSAQVLPRPVWDKAWHTLVTEPMWHEVLPQLVFGSTWPDFLSNLLPPSNTGTRKVLALSPDGRLVASAPGTRQLRVHRVDTGEHVSTWSSPQTIHSMAFSPDGRLLVGAGTQAGVYVWDATSRQATWPRVATWPAQPSQPTLVRFSPDGRYLATASDTQVSLWDTASPPPAWRRITHWTANASVRGLAWSPDGAHLATAGSQGVEVRHQSATAGAWPITAHISGDFTSVAFSPNGRYLATAGRLPGWPPQWSRVLQLWWVSPTSTWRETSRFHTNEVSHALAFSPDSQRLAAPTADRVRIWEVGRAAEVAQVIDTEPIWDLAFTPDGVSLATAGAKLTLWEATAGEDAELSLRIIVSPTAPAGAYGFDVVTASGTGTSLDAAVTLTVDPARTPSPAPYGYPYSYPRRPYGYGSAAVGGHLI